MSTALACGLALALGGGIPAAQGAHARADADFDGAGAGARMAQMRAAADEFGIPVRLLEAVSYDETRWEPTAGPSVDGGYGLMDLTTPRFRSPDGAGGPGQAGSGEVTLAASHDTLEQAARLLGLSPVVLERDPAQNIRGAAAVLARYERRLDGGRLPASPGLWYGALARYSGATTAQAASIFADQVFTTLRRGATLTTSDGQRMALQPTAGVRPAQGQLARLGLRTVAAQSRHVDCPRSVKCTFIPAAYAQDGSDPANYGNYATAGRVDHMRSPAGAKVRMPIRYIIIHDTEGTYAATISIFQNPSSYVSANYVVRSSDGEVAEMVRPRNVSWGADNWYINMHAINIENEGFAAEGAKWYTDAEYRSDARLVRYLAARYHIPLNREHILGHEDVPGVSTAGTATQHWDPGPFWNWNHFMALVNQVSDKAEQARGGSIKRGDHRLLTIDPTFSLNKPPVSNCTDSGCSPLPKQAANFVYIRTGPGARYPLFGDPTLHPGGGAGTTVDSDWGDKATIGETFVFAGQRGRWTAIWYAGHKLWFANPPGAQRTARYLGGEVITPKPGRKSIPVYGIAFPNASAFPSKVPPATPVKLVYKIPAGQFYPEAGSVPNDYYYAPTIKNTRPHDHTLIIGHAAFIQISFNHRKFFVRASDVTVRRLS